MPPGIAENSKSLRILLTAACAVLLIWSLKVAQPFLVPVVVAFFLAQLAAPLMTTLRKNRIPLPVAVAFTALLNIVVIVGVVFISVNLITNFIPQVRPIITDLLREGGEIAQKLQDSGHMNDAKASWDKIAQPGAQAILGFVNQTDIIGRTVSLFSTAFFVLLLMVFMLLEGGSFSNRITSIRKLHGPNFGHLRTVSQDIQKYLGVKTLVSAATGTLAGGLCAILEVEGALLWGLLAFFLNFIPAIGSILAAIPPVLVTLVDKSVGPASAVLIGYIVINIIFGNLIEPLLLGRRFGVSTLVVLISVLFWGWLWGPVGMFLAVPLTMLVKVVLDNTADFEWISVGMGKAAPKRVTQTKEVKASGGSEEPAAVPQEP